MPKLPKAIFTKENDVTQLLTDEGYSLDEIKRSLTIAIEQKVISSNDEGCYILNPERIDIVRKYCLLDIIANFGTPISVGNESGCLLIAGFETSWGLPLNEVVKKAQEIFPELNKLWPNIQTAFDDIQWLINNGFVITK